MNAFYPAELLTMFAIQCVFIFVGVPMSFKIEKSGHGVIAIALASACILVGLFGSMIVTYAIWGEDHAQDIARLIQTVSVR